MPNSMPDWPLYQGGKTHGAAGTTSHEPDRKSVKPKPDEMLAAAIGYASLGWRVFPTNRSKKPFDKGGVHNGTTDQNAVREMWAKHPNANIAVSCGAESGIVCLDIDSKHGATVESVEEVIGPLPHTPNAITTSGGWHYIFVHPGFKVGNWSFPELPGCDIRGDAGYILVEPSSTPKGGYHWRLDAEPADTHPAPLPDRLLELLRKKHEEKTKKPTHTSNGHPITGVIERRCLDAIGRIKIDDNGDGSRRLLKVACRCVQHNLDDDAAITVIRQYEQERPFPRPYSDPEILQRIRDAEKRQKRDTAYESQVKLQTDIGLAARLVKRYGDTLRFCYGPNQWHVWDKTRWKPDDSGEVDRMAKDTVLAIYDEAKRAETPEEQKKISDFCCRSQRRDRISAMIYLARTELGVQPNELDCDEFLFNCLNGTIDLRTGTLQPHNQADLITKIATVTYDPDAKAPLWHRFLNRTFNNDLELIRFLQRWFGYCLTADVREQILPIFHGSGSNGKSVLLDTISAVMGDYSADAPPDLLTQSRHDRHPTELADLHGRRLVVASETERNQALRIQLVKKMTGDSTLKARRMRQDFYQFKRTHKTILCTNNKPVIFENSVATWRRIRLIPFGVTIPEHEQDKSLIKNLRSEWPGILAWMVRGCLDWQEHGLGEPEAVKSATESYRMESDQMGRFLLDCCVTGQRESVTSKRLREEFEGYCLEGGETPMGGRAYAKELQERGFKRGKDANSVRIWVGLGMKSEPIPDTSDTSSA